MKISHEKVQGIERKLYLCSAEHEKRIRIMEERKFKNRREQMEDYARRMGWGPLTEEDKIALDDIVRMVTKLDSKPRYAVVSN